jgi:hypothetical protein
MNTLLQQPGKGAQDESVLEETGRERERERGKEGEKERERERKRARKRERERRGAREKVQTREGKLEIY